jgi:hypothetical protein
MQMGANLTAPLTSPGRDCLVTGLLRRDRIIDHICGRHADRIAEPLSAIDVLHRPDTGGISRKRRLPVELLLGVDHDH